MSQVIDHLGAARSQALTGDYENAAVYFSSVVSELDQCALFCC
jgi:hypothetical protein